MNKPEYVFPRICIVDLSKKMNVPQLLSNLAAYHHKYYHVFNLTNIKLSDSQFQTNFKWRGPPFSITQSVKILLKMDIYLRSNCANTVVFCVNQHISYLYAQILIRQYLTLSFQSSKYSSKSNGLTNMQTVLSKIKSRLSEKQPYFECQMLKMYNSIKIANPPVKILSSFQIYKANFIPIIQVFRQSRYNQLELIYTHDIQNELSQYYLNLNKPLRTSIGSKHYDQKPQTKYMKTPVLIYGDTFIKCYSFCTLEKKLQFCLGFNTEHLIFQEQFDNGEGIIAFEDRDLFQKRSDSASQARTYIKIQNYCQKQSCFSQSNCQECQEIIKKLPHRYNQVQTQLNKLHRDRSTKDLQNVFSLNNSQLS